MIKKILLLLLFAGLSIQPICAEEVNTTSNVNKKWWKEGVVYQIYPRSFKDSDGNGIGDIRGIIEKLDYVKSLGVDIIWLNPIFESPNDDNGYDISNYEGIMKEFGTMADFDQLLMEMHKRGLKLVLDLVVNHSSSEHEWFKQSRSSRENPYRNYYHWWNAEKGTPPARYSFFDVESNAWEFDKKTNAYYLHYFSDKQPDLNWENPKLRAEIYKMMRFWFEKGVDGFRMDVIPFIAKDQAFPEFPADDMLSHYATGPKLHDYLQEMHREVLQHYNIMTVAEGIAVKPQDGLKFVDPARKELDMLYHFDGVHLGYLPNKFKVMDPKGYDLREFKKIYSTWDAVFAQKGWGTIYLGNHDQPRMVTRWGNDSPEFRELSSKMLTTFLMTMRATPYYYYGDELAMNNIKFNSIADYRDIESINMYQQLQKNNGNLKEFIEAQKISARDNSRTPFQWDSSPNAGFTTGKPWLRVNQNYKSVNVEIQDKNQNSPLNYFRDLVHLRKSNPVLIYGDYTVIDESNPSVYAYTRKLDKKTFLIALNFTKDPAKLNTNISFVNSKVVSSNYKEKSSSALLRPYEATIYEL
ncbi:alpha-glucosidase [Cellvibrio sp. UBA7671]|uniref:glycoside hydrolase family 13 protein n=1 Tax=Cellvibrio sp. UBA7671 TaxID=1946312 RepID=UPI002F352C56